MKNLAIKETIVINFNVEQNAMAEAEIDAYYNEMYDSIYDTGFVI